MQQVLRGALAGLAGTVAISAAMAAAKAAGLMPGELPPRRVGRNVEESLGVRDELPPAAFEASWVGQHFAYGAAAGAAYELARPHVKLPEPLPSGLVFGALLWAFGYAGWLPATGLYPPPTAEPGRRVGSLLASHLLYGVVTATVARRLDPARKTPAGSASRLLRHIL